MEFTREDIKLVAKYIVDNNINIPSEFAEESIADLKLEIEKYQKPLKSDPTDNIDTITSPNNKLKDMIKTGKNIFDG